MNTPTHLAMNIIISVPLKQYFGWGWGSILIFIFVGIFIDIDHLLYFIFRYKIIKPREWLRIGKKLRVQMQARLYFFHSPEFNAILFFLSFFNHIALVILLSNIIHIFLDIIEHYRYHRNFSWMKRWSVIYSFLK